MEYRSLGRSGLKVSPLCLGTMMFGGATDNATAHRIVARAKDKGIKSVVFDRGGYQYHGRIKALADAARSAGLEF